MSKPTEDFERTGEQVVGAAPKAHRALGQGLLASW